MTQDAIDARLGLLLGGENPQPDPRFAARIATLVRAEAAVERAQRAAWRRFAGEGLCALAIALAVLVAGRMPATSLASGSSIPIALAALLLCWLFVSGQADEPLGRFRKTA